MTDDTDLGPREDGSNIERRRFLRSAGAAAGGAVLASTVSTASASGAGPAVLGRSRPPCQHGGRYSLETRGHLTGGGRWTHSHQLHEHVCGATVTVDYSSYNDGADFDLYVTLDGRTPTVDDYDRKSATGGAKEEVDLEMGATYGNQEIGILVKSYSGGGYFDLEVFETSNVSSTSPGPTASTDAASGISDSTATLNGSLDDAGDADQLDVFFEYREAGTTDSWSATGGETMTSTGSFSQTAFGLVEDTEYEFRAVAVAGDDNKTDRGSVETFTTDSGGWCFVTTATHRRDDTLNSLRRFRDESMAATPVGRGLVGLYYRISPPIARTLERHPESRTAGTVRRLVRACAALSDRQDGTESRVASAGLGVALTLLYVVGILVAAASHAGLSALELFERA